jgi:hypothetical protein
VSAAAVVSLADVSVRPAAAGRRTAYPGFSLPRADSIWNELGLAKSRDVLAAFS